MLKYIIPRVVCPPLVYIWVYRLLGRNQHCLINKNTGIVIEGFPRSANTFAVVAFKKAQKNPVHVAHHLHVTAHVLEGIRRKIPVLVLIRNPLDAVKSLKIRNPNVDENNALIQYIKFYVTVAENTDHVVIGRFEDVISDYGRVIEKINHKFGSNFSVFRHNAGEIRKVFDRIREINAESITGGIETIAIPVQERNTIKESLRLDYRDNLMRQAIGIYEEILEKSTTLNCR